MTSRPGARIVERVAADANVILSAVIGKAALKVFTRSPIQVFSTIATLEEVREYLPVMAKAYGLAPEIVEAQFRLLPITGQPPAGYERRMAQAMRLIGKRDPDDVDLLALALALRIPVWTNDRDFESTGVERYTTARLLKVLGL